MLKFALAFALSFAPAVHADAPRLPDFKNLVVVGEPDKAIIPPSPGPAPSPKNEVIKAKVGKIVKLSVEVTTAVTWDFDESAFDGFGIDSNGKTLYLPTPPGTWKVTAWTADKDSKPTRAKVWMVTIEGGPLPPPVPPGPNPPPVPPADFTAKLEQALAADGATDDDRALVASVYRLGVSQLPKLKLSGELVKAVLDAADAVVEGRLKQTREVVGAELSKRFPGDDSNLTDIAVQARCGKVLNDLALALDSIKPRPPTPPPSPSPIPYDGFRVLMVYESSELSKLPKGQSEAIASKTIRDYLNEKCVKKDGQPEFRVWDKDVSLTNESDLWRRAMGMPRAELPWIIISNHPKGGYSGPLPKTVQETLDLIKKHGG